MEENINEYIRHLSLSQDLGDAQTTPSLDFEKETGQWVGKVVDNEDPLHLGRCRIRVFGYYDEIDAKSLPWAIGQTSYVGGKYGNMVIPEIGTTVMGYFDNGDSQKPIYTGTFNKMESLTKSPSCYTRMTDYPQTMILMETDQGEVLSLNRKTGKLTFSHRSGTTITVAANGSIDISQPSSSGGFSAAEPAKLSINIADTANITVNGDATIESKMNVYVKAGGEINLGNNVAKQLVCNLPNCLVTGAPHAVGNIQVKV